MQKLLISFLFALSLLGAEVRGQDILSGRDIKIDRPSEFVDLALGDSSITKSGWFDISNYQFFSAFISVTLDTPTVTYWKESGLDTAQVVFAFEELGDNGGSSVTSSTKGAYEDGDGGLQAILTLSAVDTAAAQGNKILLYKSFHGTGDPDLAPGRFIRHYVTVHDTLSNLSLDYYEFVKQP